MPERSLFRFGFAEWRLFGNALNEVINGFNVPDFERTIGAEKATLEKLLTHVQALRDSDELVLGVPETRAVRNALRETIRELGVEEFHTRTGYDYEQGEAILGKLNWLLRETLKGKGGKEETGTVHDR
jgi:hypothetical protein